MSKIYLVALACWAMLLGVNVAHALPAAGDYTYEGFNYYFNGVNGYCLLSTTSGNNNNLAVVNFQNIQGNLIESGVCNGGKVGMGSFTFGGLYYFYNGTNEYCQYANGEFPTTANLPILNPQYITGAVKQAGYCGGGAVVAANTPSSQNSFNLVSANSGSCVDVQSVSQANSGPVQQYSCLGAKQLNQVWSLVPANGGYQIISENSGLCLDVVGVSKSAGAAIDQYTCLGATHTNQIWNLVATPNGTQIVSQNSGMCLDVTGQSTANGVILQQYPCLGAGQLNQLWNVVAPATSLASQKASVSDFNGDGKSDILWYNNQNGQISIWNDGVSGPISGYSVPITSGWVIAGNGDFNGDGQKDILWYNTQSGAISVWYSAKPGVVLYTVAPSSGWVIAGVGDFNGDGRSDILWYNTQSGALAIWYEGNPGPVLAWSVPASSGWVISGIGDFNGDGKSDILWHNTQTGGLSIWYGGVEGPALSAVVAPSSGWAIAGVGDFNGDGKSDILWYNSLSGQVVIWYDANQNTYSVPGTVAPSSGWVIAGVGDYNGDGVSDILWQNLQSGTLAIWYSGNPGPLLPSAVPLSSGWVLSSNNLEQRYPILQEQMISTHNAFLAMSIGQRAGYKLVVLNGGTTQSAEFFADLSNPLTGTVVASFSQQDVIGLTNVPSSVPTTAGVATLGNSYDCPVQSAALSFFPSPNGLVPDSVLRPGITSVNVQWVAPAAGTDPTGAFGSENSAYDGQTAAAAAAQILTTDLGFPINDTPIGSANAFQNASDPYSPAASSGSSSTVANILVQCGTPTAGFGGDTQTISITHSTTAIVTLNCSLYQTSNYTIDAIMHEVMHALGFDHDVGDDMMDYADVYRNSPSAIAVPAGAAAAVKAMTSSTATSLNFATCQTRLAYHASSCILNSQYESDCGSTAPSTPPGAPVPTPTASAPSFPEDGGSCPNSCGQGYTQNSDCSCSSVTVTLCTTNCGTDGNTGNGPTTSCDTNGNCTTTGGGSGGTVGSGSGGSDDGGGSDEGGGGDGGGGGGGDGNDYDD